MGVPRSHNREPAARNDNELINVSLTQQTGRDEMQFVHTPKFQTQKSQKVTHRKNQGKAGMSDLCSKDKLGCAVSRREKLSTRFNECDRN